MRIKAAQWAARGTATEILDAKRIADLTGAQTYCGGWLDPRGGKIQPLMYALTGESGRISGSGYFVNSAVKTMLRSAGRWRLGTAQGNLIAKQVVLATNGYTDGLWPQLQETVVPAYSIQVSTEPLAPEIRKPFCQMDKGFRKRVVFCGIVRSMHMDGWSWERAALHTIRPLTKTPQRL